MPESRHNFAIALVSGLPVVSAIFVGLRLYARYVRRIRFAWDDWLLVIAVILSFGLICPSVLNIKVQFMGYHLWEAALTTEQMDPNFQEYYGILLSITLLNAPILPLAKASILLVLLKVGKIINFVRRYLYVVFVFNFLACIIPWAMYIFICPPRTGDTWAPTTFGGLRCFGRDTRGKILLFINCANLVTDVLIFPIPFFIMRELMTTDIRARLTVMLTFASSLCVTALSASKIYITFRDRILLWNTPDWTYSIEFCITHGESNVGIIVACLPMLRGLVSSRFRRQRSEASYDQSATYASRGPMGGLARNNSIRFYNEHVLNTPEPPITSLPMLDAAKLREKARLQENSDDDVESGGSPGSSTVAPLLESTSRYTFCGTPMPQPAHVHDK